MTRSGWCRRHLSRWRGGSHGIVRSYWSQYPRDATRRMARRRPWGTAGTSHKSRGARTKVVRRIRVFDGDLPFKLRVGQLPERHHVPGGWLTKTARQNVRLDPRRLGLAVDVSAEFPVEGQPIRRAPGRFEVDMPGVSALRPLQPRTGTNLHDRRWSAKIKEHRPRFTEVGCEVPCSCSTF